MKRQGKSANQQNTCRFFFLHDECINNVLPFKFIIFILLRYSLCCPLPLCGAVEDLVMTRIDQGAQAPHLIPFKKTQLATSHRGPADIIHLKWQRVTIVFDRFICEIHHRVKMYIGISCKINPPMQNFTNSIPAEKSCNCNKLKCGLIFHVIFFWSLQRDKRHRHEP